MSKIQVSAKMKIPEGMLEEFKVQVTECIKQVMVKDHGTLQYDWFLSCDKANVKFARLMRVLMPLYCTNRIFESSCEYYLKNLVLFTQ